MQERRDSHGGATALVAAMGLAAAAALAGPAAAAPTFSGPANYTDNITFSAQHRGVAAGQLAAGGRPEIVLVGPSVGVLRLTDDPNTPALSINVGSEPATDIYYSGFDFEDVAIGSLNNDGRPDFVAVGSGGVQRFVQTDLADFKDDGAWLDGMPQTDPPVPPTPLDAVAVGRVNGDSLADIVAVGPDGGWVITQRGDGGFNPPQPFLVDQPGREVDLEDVVIRDFSGDGRFDLAVAGSVAGRAGVHVVLQADGFTFPTASRIVTGTVRALVVARLDGGTTADIAASLPSADQVVIRLNDGRGNFRSGPSPISLSDNPGPLAVADLDRDGIPDLVVARRDSARSNPMDERDRASILTGRGDGSYSVGSTVLTHQAVPPDQESSENDLRSIAVADVDLDGRLDLLFADSSLSAAIVARNTSITPAPPPPEPPDPTDPNPPDPGPGDRRDSPGSSSAGLTGAAGATGGGPGLSLSGRPKASLKRIAIAASCATACRITAKGKISLHPRARKKLKLGTVTKALGPGGSILLELPIPRPGRPALKRAISRGSRVFARVVVSAEDARGTVATENLKIRLGPARPGRG